MGISPSVQTFFSIGYIQLYSGWDEWDVHMLQECSQIIIQLKYPVNYTKSTEINIGGGVGSLCPGHYNQEPPRAGSTMCSKVGWSELSSWHLSGCVCGSPLCLNAESKIEKQGENRKYVKTQFQAQCTEWAVVALWCHTIKWLCVLKWVWCNFELSYFRIHGS